MKGKIHGAAVASTKRRGLILVVFVLALWGLFGNSYFGNQTPDIPKDNHIFHGSSYDLSLSASQVNYKNLYEELLASKSGNSEAVQQLSSELATERLRNNNLMESLQQQQSSYLPELPKLPASFSTSIGTVDLEPGASRSWIDSIKDSVNYITTSISPDIENGEFEQQNKTQATNHVAHKMERKEYTPLEAPIPPPRQLPVLPQPLLAAEVVSSDGSSVPRSASMANSLAQSSDAVKKEVENMHPKSEVKEESQLAVTLQATKEWPMLGSLEYVTQEVVNELTYNIGGQPLTESAGTCGNKEACRKIIGSGPFLGSPPGGRNWRVCLMPKTERGGVRAFMLLEQGIRLHPNITWVEIGDIKSADWVIWMPGSTKLPSKSECPPQKLIVIDFGDGFQPLPISSDPKNYGFYFKRSWVSRKYAPVGPRTVSVPNYAKKKRYFPMSYSIAEEFLLESGSKKVADVLDVNRIRPVVCTLRPAGRGSRDVRKEVLGWVTEAVKEWDLKGSAVGEVDHGGRREIQNKNYLQTMREARIVVTANPTGWEGDSRTWEALASGAMVMVDKLETPLPHPLLDKVHVVYYDSSDKASFFTLLKHYLDHPDEAKIIGINGHAHAVKYHRTVNRADYMLNVVFHHKEKLWEKVRASPNNTGRIRRKLLAPGSQHLSLDSPALSLS